MNGTKGWKDRYSTKLCTAAEAVESIKNDDRVLIAGVTGRPEHIIRAMVDNAANYRNVKVMHGLSNGNEDYCEERYSESFIHESLFASKSTRKYFEQGRVKFYPVYYYELPYLLEDGTIPVNVFMLQMSPPNEYGYCSTGLIADYIREAIDAADVVIVQINKNVPWCSDYDCVFHIDEFTHIVEYDEELPVFARPEINDTERAVADNVASLVKDRDTIQIGIGSISDAICEALMDKKDLGVHSELLSDGLMDLWKAGVVTNKYKSFDKGTMVAAFVMGTRELYHAVDGNPGVAIKNLKNVNLPMVIAKCANLISINTCIEVDLQGQVVSGSYGLRQISGAGGQLDFMRGAMVAEDGNGRVVLAFTSTHTRKGVTASRIKPFIEDGSAVTAPRQDVDYFVTEYGIARLMGKTLKDRARGLIEIAHPDFRPELIAEYERRFKSKY